MTPSPQEKSLRECPFCGSADNSKVERIHLSHSKALGTVGAKRGRRGLTRVVRPNHRSSGREEGHRFETLAASDVEHRTLTKPLTHRTIASVMQGEQRVRGHPLLWSLPGESALRRHQSTFPPAME